MGRHLAYGGSTKLGDSFYSSLWVRDLHRVGMSNHTGYVVVVVGITHCSAPHSWSDPS